MSFVAVLILLLLIVSNGFIIWAYWVSSGRHPVIFLAAIFLLDCFQTLIPGDLSVGGCQLQVVVILFSAFAVMTAVWALAYHLWVALAFPLETARFERKQLIYQVVLGLLLPLIATSTTADFSELNGGESFFGIMCIPTNTPFVGLIRNCIVSFFGLGSSVVTIRCIKYIFQLYKKTLNIEKTGGAGKKGALIRIFIFCTVFNIMLLIISFASLYYSSSQFYTEPQFEYKALGQNADHVQMGNADMNVQAVLIQLSYIVGSVMLLLAFGTGQVAKDALRRLLARLKACLPGIFKRPRRNADAKRVGHAKVTAVQSRSIPEEQSAPSLNRSGIRDRIESMELQPASIGESMDVLTRSIA